MSVLPDELWRRILEMGVYSATISHRDLCCLSISCRRLRGFSEDEALWSSLLSSDFPQKNNDSYSSSSSANPSPSSSKCVYRIRFERDRARKLAEHRRAVVRVESQIAVQSRTLQDLKRQAREETLKFETATEELSNLHRARQASVALNVWQPEVIRSRQRQLVEHSVVPIESRINALEMEVKLCRQLVAGLDKSIRLEKHRLDAAKERLVSMNYHPLQEKEVVTAHQCTPKRKKIKNTNSWYDLKSCVLTDTS